jgi:hypothetical protein
MTDNALGSVLNLVKNAYVIQASDPQTTETGNLTLELWAFVNAIDPQANLVRKFDTNGPHYHLSLYQDEGSSFCSVELGGTVLSAPLPNLYAHWIHFAVTVSTIGGVSRLKLLIDGNIVAQTNLAAPWADVAGEVQLGQGLDGCISEFRRWDRAWEQTLVKAQRTQSLNGIEPNLKSWLPLNDTHQLLDVVQHIGYQGALHQWVEKALPFVPQTTNVLFLDQNNESISTTFSEGFPQQRFTVEFWFRSFHATSSSVILDYASGAGLPGLRLSNPLDLTIQIGATQVSTGINLVNGDWQHFALCWNKLSGKLTQYLNGQMIDDLFTLLPADDVPDAGLFKVGASDDGQNGDGGFYLSDLRLWSTCRTSDEIKSNFLNRQEGNEYPLSLYWPLNQDTGNNVATPIENGLFGNLVGGRWTQEPLAIALSVAQQLRQLRERAELFDALPPPDNSGPGEPVGDVGLAFDTQTFMSQLTSQLTSVDINNFNLTNVDIEAKVILDSDSSKIIVPYPNRLASLDPDHYSTLKFSFAPAFDEPIGEVTVPYLIGNTSQFAMEQLNQLGLGHRILHQVTSDPAQFDVVLEQQPAANTVIENNNSIMLIIGSASGN